MNSLQSFLKGRQSFSKLGSKLALNFLLLILMFSVLVAPLPSVWAFVPPASSITATLRLRQCVVRITLETNKTTYNAGDLVPVTVKLERVSGPAGYIRGTIPLAGQSYEQYIDAANSGLLGTSPQLKNSPGYERISFETTGKVSAGQAVSGIVNIKLKSAVPSGTYISLLGQPSSFNSANSNVSCKVINGSAAFTTGIGVNYDLSLAQLLPNLTGVAPGQLFNVLARMRNESGVVPRGEQITYTLVYPLGLEFSSVEPESVCAKIANEQKIQCNLTSGTNNLAVGEYVPTLPNVAFKVISYSDAYVLTGCAKASRDSNVANDCANASVFGSALTIGKTWLDGSATLKTNVAAQSTLDFVVKVKNTTGFALSGIELRDKLISSINCNSISNSNCSPWDGSVLWQNIPAGITEDPVTHELVWNAPLNFTPGQEYTYNLQAKVVDSVALRAKLAVNSDARCNGAYAATANGVRVQARLCFEFLNDDGSDLKTSKAFLINNTEVLSAAYQQGEVGTYAITMTNEGQSDAPSVDFFDQQTIRINHADARRFVRWDTESMPSGLTADNDSHTISGTLNQPLAPSAQRKINPRFAIVCDAYDRMLRDMNKKDRDAAVIDNYAIADGQNDKNRNNGLSNTVSATITNAHYNLGTFVTADPVKVIPSDAAANTTTLTVILNNEDSNQSVNLPVPLVRVTAQLPTVFDAVASTNNSYKVETRLVNGEQRTFIVWNRVESVQPQAVIQLQARIRVKDSAPTGDARVNVTAQSLSSGDTCGIATGQTVVNVSGYDLIPVKSADLPDLQTVNRGEEFDYQLLLRNVSTYNADQPILHEDVISAQLLFVSSGQCTSNQGPQFCRDAVTTPVYDGASRKLTWTVNRLPARGEVTQKFKVKVREDVVIDSCPQSVSNSVAISVPATGFVRVSSPVTIGILPDQCIEGNVYVRKTAAGGNLVFSSTDLVIGKSSVLSSRGSVVCGDNQSCIEAPFKIGNYTTDQEDSAGLSWESVVTRLYRNRARLEKSAQKLGNSGKIRGSFNLYGSNSENIQDTKLKNLGGGVWLREGDLEIDTRDLQLTGLGTIIVKGGNVTIKGCSVDANSNSDPNSPQCLGLTFPGSDNKQALGLIVVPSADNVGGNVYIDGSIRKLENVAIYAPGTSTDVSIDSNSGVVEFRRGPQALRPAKGLFIAKKFIINRDRATFQYAPVLNNATTAPPGFSFTVSPSGTQEGE